MVLRGKVKAAMKKVNEVSKMTGVSRRTLQYYDDQGLLSAKRSKDNHRQYDEEALERTWQILVYKEMDFKLREIRYLLQLTEEDQGKYLEQKIRQINQQIEELGGQKEFISLVKNRGMPSKPEKCEKTYVQQILDMKKRKDRKN